MSRDYVNDDSGFCEGLKKGCGRMLGGFEGSTSAHTMHSLQDPLPSACSLSRSSQGINNTLCIDADAASNKPGFLSRNLRLESNEWLQ